MLMHPVCFHHAGLACSICLIFFHFFVVRRYVCVRPCLFELLCQSQLACSVCMHIILCL